MKEGSISRNNGGFNRDIPPKILSETIRKTVDNLRKKVGLSEQQIIQLIKESGQSIQIPTSIFSNKRLSGLELICKYLKEEIQINFSQSAKLLNRDYRTVWASYIQANKKQKSRLAVPASKYFFPINILANRQFSVLETIVTFMKEQLGLRLSEIAHELYRDQRNVWTVYKRAGAKNGRNNSDFNRDISPKILSETIRKTIDNLREKVGLSEQQIIQLIKESGQSIQIPTSIFSNKRLSGLELVCKYLKDELDISFSKSAELLKRDYQTVWTSYRTASRKRKVRLAVPASKYFFPISALANRNFSVLDAIVMFMKEQLGLKYSEIAAELHRDQRNIWTVYRRANAKNK